ncbi:MAG: ribonuclease E inhibitor RraB [Verrucomicrobiota bacterium]|jgi:hypothetical protein
MKIDITEQIDGHLRRNEDLKKTLCVKGVELGEQRSIELHFWAFKKQDAVNLAKSLYDHGLLVLTLAPVPDDEGERWNIEAGIKDTVQDLTSPSNVRKFVELAAQFNALFDGWGTVV